MDFYYWYKGYMYHIFSYGRQELTEVMIQGKYHRVKSERAAKLFITKTIKQTKK